MIGKILKRLDPWAGKLTGAALGLVSGLGVVGMVFGAVLGHIADTVRGEYRQQKALARYFLSPKTERDSLSADMRKTGFTFLVALWIRDCEGSVSKIDRAEAAEWAARYHGIGQRQRHVFLGAVGRVMDSGNPDIPALSADFALDSTAEERLAFLGSLLDCIKDSLTERRRGMFREICFSMGFSEEALRDLARKHGRARPEDYRLLGVTEDSANDEIRTVYRKLASQFHPDITAGLSSGQRNAANEAFIRITEAYKRIVADREFRASDSETPLS
jgi:hypothetical protein